MPAKKLLIVDDERGILETLSSILSGHGFEVTSASTVSDGLHAITSTRFDILIADLNIGQPGDGFTVVSALRRTHPDAVALIITGYPGFDAALTAIREQVDDFLVKPIHPDELVARIESLTRSRRKHVPLPRKPLGDIIKAEKPVILQSMIADLRQKSGEVEVQFLSDQELLDSLPDVIDELCKAVKARAKTLSPEALKDSREHGRTRFQQGYGLGFILDESSMLRQRILDALHRNMLLVDLSSLLLDMSFVSTSLDAMLKTSITEYARLALGEAERSRH